MSITTLVVLIRLTDADGNPKDTYQNGRRDNTTDPLTNESRDIDLVKYAQNFKNTMSFQTPGMLASGFTGTEVFYYLPFLYQGASKNRTGDNLEAALVFPNNVLAMNKARQAVKEKWQIEVCVCIAKPHSTYGLVVERLLTSDIWLAASMSYDFETVEILLSSAIDAVGSNAPTSVLTSDLVGALPTSGDIQNL
tara:strand:- start:4384 stop:4965 length:582 start_codon:yes stop_codon:yes gene_type:complete